MENKEQKNLQVIITLGLPASSKSTWAKEQIKKYPNKYKRINKDLLREMLDSSIWSKQNEKLIVETRDMLILKYLDLGFDVIVDDTNFGKHVSHITQLVEGKAEVVVKDFTDVPVEMCIIRDTMRPNSVGRQVILRMYNQFLKDKPYKVEYDDSLWDCVLCDLDGTLCLFGDKNPYERDFENDEVNDPLYKILKNYTSQDSNHEAELIFFSGRNGKYRDVTLSWLEDRFGKGSFKLYMRAEDDNRKDSIVKEEMYNTYIKGKYNVLAVFDDRNQVCRLWRRLGLPLFQVGDSDVEF